MEPARALVSEADFLALPESNERIELIDGEVILSPSSTVWHQVVLRRILRALEDWSEERSEPIFIGQSPLDVRFGANRVLQPDAFVVLAEVPLEHKGPVNVIPALCVEVLSTDRLYDRVTKRFIYGAAGVREYWIVEHAGLIERWTGPGLADSQEVRDRLTTPLLPGFELDLKTVFAFKR